MLQKDISSAIELIRNPERMNRGTVDLLKRAIEQYPYHQALYLLLLQNMYKVHDPQFGEALKKYAVMVADRSVLFDMVEGINYEIPIHSVDDDAEFARKDGDRTLLLIDSFLHSLPESSQSASHSSADPLSDYSAYLEMLPDYQSEEEQQGGYSGDALPSPTAGQQRTSLAGEVAFSAKDERASGGKQISLGNKDASRAENLDFSGNANLASVNRELSSDGTDLPSSGTDLSLGRTELPLGRIELASDRIELASDRIELASDKVALPSDRVALPSDKFALSLGDNEQSSDSPKAASYTLREGDEDSLSADEFTVEAIRNSLSEDDEKIIDESVTSAPESEYFTETMAGMYIKQQKYSQALEIIRVLSAANPKKSVYFADQIRYLELLIKLKHTKE